MFDVTKPMSNPAMTKVEGRPAVAAIQELLVSLEKIGPIRDDYNRDGLRYGSDLSEEE